MIDCSKTENYFAEKLRMTKAYESGFCRIRCEHCPLDKKKIVVKMFHAYN